MNVIRASVMGYCAGVRKAIQAAEKADYTLGPIVHNEAVCNRFKVIGEPLSSYDVAGKTVVTQAHGTKLPLIDYLISHGANVIDGTCAKIQASLKLIDSWPGSTVIIVGDPKHDEVRALVSHAEQKGVRWSVISEVQPIEIGIGENALVIAQTTFDKARYQQVRDALKGRVTTVANTICSAMDDRLKAVDELMAKGVDGIVVVGSTTSANTHRLLERAEMSVPATLVNGAGLLSCFLAGKNLIGLTAGASTPDEIILEVENEIRNYRV